MVIRATRRSRRSSSFSPVQKESFSLRPSQGFDFKTLSIELGIEPASFQLCGQALYRLRLAQMNNSPWENIFPAGERSALDTRDGFDLYSAQASFTWPHVDLSRPLHARSFGLFGCIASLSKSAGFISLAGKVSLVSISYAILFLPSQIVYLPLEFEFRGKSCVGKGAWRPRYHLMPHIPCVLNCMKGEFDQIITGKFVWVLRTTTTNCHWPLFSIPYKF